MRAGVKLMKASQISSTRNKTILLLILLLPICILLNLCCGTVWVPIKEMVAILFGNETGSVVAPIILYARLPRVVGCLAAGSALAISGAVIQSVLNNPLAAPNVIGVNAGAGAAVAICGALVPTAVAFTPIAAFLGAFISVVLVFAISRHSGASKITLVLAGIAISGIFSAITDSVVTLFPDALISYFDFRIGGLNNLYLEKILPAAGIIIVASIAVFFFCGELDILMLGAETAQSLGLPVKRFRLLMLTLAALLAGAAISFAGLIGFVGLVIPHIMRHFVGEESFLLLLSSSLGGAIFLSLCDLIARVLFSPYELPVGIILSLIGGPFFIWLLLSQRGGRKHG